MKAKYIRVSTKEQNTDRQTDFDGLTYPDECSGSIAFKDRCIAAKRKAKAAVDLIGFRRIQRRKLILGAVD